MKLSSALAWTISLVLPAAVLGQVAVDQTHQPIGMLVAGVNRETGEVPVRKEINDLAREGGIPLTIYLRSLAALQNADADDPLSYFQIAGVHGYPIMEWNGAGPGNRAHIGYCPHGEEIFMTWHRVYVSLFEQSLYRHARRLAREYPANVRDEYIQAADNMRVPYWDWATNVNVPPITATARVTVTVPDGNGGTREEQIANPLFAYNFPREATRGDFNHQFPANTNRCVQNGVSDPTRANAQLANLDLAASLYTVFTQSNSFTRAMTLRGGGFSFEGLHGTIHNLAACRGSILSSVPMSSFDPLFWLHHANVDRLFALWQFIYADQAMFSEQYSAPGTYGIADGTPMTPLTPLSPFYRDDDNMYNSNQTISIMSFGYTYPGLRPWERNIDALSGDAASIVNNLYGGIGNGNNNKKAKRGFRRALTSRSSTSYANSNFVVSIAFSDISKFPKSFDIELILATKKDDKLVTLGSNKVGISTIPSTKSVVSPFVALNKAIGKSDLLDDALDIDSQCELLNESLYFKIIHTDSKEYDLEELAKYLTMTLHITDMNPPPSTKKLASYTLLKEVEVKPRPYPE